MHNTSGQMVENVIMRTFVDITRLEIKGNWIGTEICSQNFISEWTYCNHLLSRVPLHIYDKKSNPKWIRKQTPSPFYIDLVINDHEYISPLLSNCKKAE